MARWRGALRDAFVECAILDPHPVAVSDPALDALMLPFAEGRIARVAGALFLGARAGAALHASQWPGLACVQAFRPQAQALERAGFEVRAEAEPGRGRPLVLVLPPRQREAARALYAQARALAGAGATVVASVANDEGAKSGKADFVRLFGPAASLSKHKCRVFWARADGAGDDALAAQWREAEAPREVAPGWWSRPGVFAWDRIDPASALLIAHLPATLAGEGADLGAGNGVLAAAVLERCAGVRGLDLYEADARALALAERNLAPHAARVRLGFRWHDVAAGVPGRYDFVVANPPFHAQGRAPRPELGQAFVRAAAVALRPGGELWLVANRQLPYEQALADGFAEVRTVVQRDGFKVVAARRAR